MKLANQGSASRSDGKADNDNPPDPQPAEKTAAIFTTAE